MPAERILLPERILTQAGEGRQDIGHHRSLVVDQVDVGGHAGTDHKAPGVGTAEVLCVGADADRIMALAGALVDRSVGRDRDDASVHAAVDA